MSSHHTGHRAELLWRRPLVLLLAAFAFVAPTSTGAQGVAPAATSQPVQVTLAKLLAHAEQHAPDIAVARSRLGLGDAGITAASPLLPDNPELEVALGPRLGPGGSELQLEVSLSQRLEIAGERGLRLEAARLGKDRLGAVLARVRWAVHCRVHQAYHAALVARERARAADLRLAFARRLLDITRRRHAAGAISALEVEVVKGEVAQARQTGIRAHSTRRNARLILAEVSGWPPGSEPEPAGGLETPRQAPPPVQLLKAAHHNSQMLQVLQARVLEAEARTRLASRAAFPKPEVGASYSREVEIGGEANHIVMGSVALPIPLWRRNQGSRARARAQVTVARARYRSQKRQLQAQVQRTSAAVNAAARRVKIFGREVVPAFASNLSMVSQSFKAGKVDVMQVMVARGRFLEIQRAALDAHDDYYQAQARLEAVVGKEIWQ